MAEFPDAINNAYISSGKIGFTCFHLNIRSARHKEDELLVLLNEFAFKFDIIMLTETWYSSNDEVCRLEGYRSFFINRQRKQGGGIEILIRNEFQCEIISELSFITDDFECLVVMCNKTIYSVMYRPPNSQITNFITHLERLLNYATENNLELILGGDFNIDVRRTGPAQESFRLMIESNGFAICTETPTRVTIQTESVLDLFITNTNINEVLSGVVCSGISDHFPIYLFLERHNNRTHAQAAATVRFQNLTEETLHSFNSRLMNESWTDVFRCETADAAYEKFISVFKRIYLQSFKDRIFKTNGKNRKPWINQECLRRIKQKNKLYKKFLKTRLVSDLQKFKQYRNKLTSFLKNEKRCYLHSQFQQDACKGSADMWRKINKLLNLRVHSPVVEELVSEGRRVHGIELAEKFNTFFKEIVKSSHCPPPADHAIPRNTKSIFFEPTDESEIQTIVNTLPNSKARDVDDIQIGPIKYVINTIAPVLSYIYNLALSTGCFPKLMQVSKVIVLFKGGDKNEMSNYRPISILPVFSKVLEKVIHNRLLNFCTKFELITPAQYGFRPKRSTETALLMQKEIILDALESKQLCIGVFVDFSKAFDRLNHQTLLQKLELYGIRGIASALLKSYLEHRFQCVAIGKDVSTFQRITTGVPQGSILGPLLFTLYVNDITRISNKPHYILYADDTSLLFKGTNIPCLISTINGVLETLNSWSRANSLLINSKKTKAVLFHSRQSVVSLDLQIQLDNTITDVVDTVKTLGVFFHENMSWDHHINSVLSKLAKSVGILARVRSFFPVSIKLLLYNALFVSHVNYCFLVWGNTTKTNIHKIYLLQKKAVRHIANVDYLAHTKELFTRFNIVPAYQLYEFCLATRYKNPFRKQQFWYLPFCRTEHGRQMMRYALPALLNKFISNRFSLERASVRAIREYFL